MDIVVCFLRDTLSYVGGVAFTHPSVNNAASMQALIIMLWGSNPWWSVTQVSHLKAHLFNLGQTVPSEMDANSHLKWPRVLCDHEALAVLRFGHLGHFLETGDLADISVSNVLHLFKCGDSKCWSKGLHKTPETVKCKGHCGAHPTTVL
jgi:hypothetical protein